MYRLPFSGIYFKLAEFLGASEMLVCYISQEGYLGQLGWRLLEYCIS